MSPYISAAALTIVGALAAVAVRGNAPMQSANAESGADAAAAPRRLHQAADGCDVPTQQWLSFVPKRIELCGTTSGDPSFPTAGRTGSFDINGDGQLDYVTCSPQWEPLGQGGLPSSLPNLITVSELIAEGTGVTARQGAVWVPGTAIGEAILVDWPGSSFARVYVSGWRDVDADGDLDLVVYLQINPGSSSGQNLNCYFENIGYEKPAPPVAADLNRDGRVDGADLGLVLLAWGTKP